MAPLQAKIGEGGRVVIPAEFREALGVKPGDVVLLSLVDGQLHLETPQRAMRRAQELFRAYIPKG